MSVTPLNLDAFLADVERRAFRIARTATRHDADALDIVQEAMLKLVQTYRHRPGSEWPALFHRILQNCIMDWYRREHRQKGLFSRWLKRDDDELEEDPIENIPEEADSNPLTLISRAQDIDTVLNILETLPLRQQQTFLLRVWEGLDVAQTAEAMGCSEGSIKTHLFRAMQALRTALEAT